LLRLSGADLRIMAMWLALHHTAWGRHVFAIGSNESAGRLTGVPVDRVKISGLRAVLSGGGLQRHHHLGLAGLGACKPGAPPMS
jgi:predicted ABC-type sugar transport system permease subunit